MCQQDIRFRSLTKQFDSDTAMDRYVLQMMGRRKAAAAVQMTARAFRPPTQPGRGSGC